MKNYLYHGSSTSGIQELEPRVSLEYKKLVYATPDFRYALVRAGRQIDMIREEYYALDEPFELAECYPDAFKKMFSCTGYIYLLDPKDFVKSNDLEYVSEKPVKPIKVLTIDNIWSEMLHHKEWYKFVPYYDADFWNTVRGGLDGYLARKRAAKKKMMEMQAT